MINYKRPAGHQIIECSIDPTAIIGDDSIVWWYARILQHVVIGRGCSIGGGAEIGRGSVIGDDTRISAGVFLPPNSQVGRRVFIGPNATFTDDMHPRVLKPGDPAYTAQPPCIEDDVSIGAGAIILPGIKLGARCRVAAGAVVTKDVPHDAMVRGVPARFRTMPEEWEHVDRAADFVAVAD